MKTDLWGPRESSAQTNMTTVYLVLPASMGTAIPQVLGVFRTFEAMVQTIPGFPTDHGLDDEELDTYGWQPVGYMFTVVKTVLVDENLAGK